MIRGLAVILFLVAAAPAIAESCARADIVGGNFDGADHFDAREAALLMRAIVGERDAPGQNTDAAAVDLPLAHGLWILVVGDRALIIRVKGDFLCRDPPIDRSVYEAARRRVRGQGV